MNRVSLTATKALRYGTRRLRAGDTFEASRQDARVLTAIGMASDAPRQMLSVRGLGRKSLNGDLSVRKLVEHIDAITDGSTDKPAAPAEPDLATLRAEYRALTGKRPHHLWRAARVAAEIAGAKADTGAAVE